MSSSDAAIQGTESDAAAQSIFPGDTKAQAGASMGEHCVTDRPTPSGEAPSGEISKLGKVDVYITKPSDYPHAPSKLLLFLTGGTGLHSTNNQLQADKYAAEGFLVIMPDLFEGDPAPNSRTELPDSESSFIEQVKLRTAETAKAFLLDMWLARHTPEKVLPILSNVLEGVKDEFADAIANGSGIYAVGYCFGAKYVMLLGGENLDNNVSGATKDEEQGETRHGPLIKAGALAHGTMITREDIAGIRVPISMVCIDDDTLFPSEVLEAGRKSLEANGVEHEIETFSGVPHGFAVLGDYDDAKIRGAQQQAFGQLLGWLQSH